MTLDIEQFSNNISRELGGIEISLKKIEDNFDFRLEKIEALIQNQYQEYEKWNDNWLHEKKKLEEDLNSLKIKTYTMSAMVAGIMVVGGWIVQKLLKI